MYGQARRAYEAAKGSEAARQRSSGASGASDELRTLAGMLLTASPSLFDDPEARRFLEQVERFSVLMFRTLSASPGNDQGRDGHERLATTMTHLKAAVEPLVARIPTEERLLLEGSPQA